MLEKYLVEHCAPTLASLKTANLFNYFFDNEENLFESINYWNKELCSKGVQLILMKVHNKGALVYVCRKDRLEKDLNKDGVKELLAECGYESNNADYAIERLKSRLAYSDDFPHEIGVFLDYPLGDVKGFISNSGANCKCTGCWKVYCNECDARKTFAKFNKCRSVYSRIWGAGQRNVMQLTVAS